MNTEPDEQSPAPIPWDELDAETQRAIIEFATTPDATDSSGLSRRDVLAGGGALGIGALLGGGARYVLTEPAAASHGTSPDGLAGAASEPLLRVHTDRVVLHERTSDPASPSDGELWYNSSA